MVVASQYEGAIFMPRIKSRPQVGGTIGTALYPREEKAFREACLALEENPCALLRNIISEWLLANGWTQPIKAPYAIVIAEHNEAKP
jgi:hypothetical protein